MPMIDPQFTADLTEILESMSDAFCVVDKAWRLVYVNAQAEKIARRSRSELLGQIFWNAFPETIQSAFFTHYHLGSTEGMNLRVEIFCASLDVWLEVHALSSQLGLAFYFRDITEQRKSKNDLKELVEQLSCEQAYVDNLLRHMPAGVMICEAPGGRVLYQNERIQQNLGGCNIAPGSIEEYATWQGFHSDDRPYEPHEWPLARSITTGEVVDGDRKSVV